MAAKCHVVTIWLSWEYVVNVDNMNNSDSSTRFLPETAADQNMADSALRASVLFALRLYNCQILEGQLHEHIRRALQAQTVGDLRKIVAAADQLLRK
jgi:hydroxypyruvate isomerase